MSIRSLTMVVCDGTKVGTGCDVSVASGDLVTEVRRDLKRRGWTRRHWCGIQIDLCSSCSTVDLPPCETRGGRPRKV